MGAPPNLLFDSLNSKTMVLENNKGDLTSRNNNNNPSNISNNNDGFLCTTTTQRANVQRQTRPKQRRSRKYGRVLMKRRSNFNENRGIERKVQTLQRLVPTHEPSLCDQGLDGLFRDTASYILSLQMKVRVMQVMVDVLENSQNHE